MQKTHFSFGDGLVLLFIGLKFTGHITWPWWLVLWPVWVTLGICIVSGWLEGR